MSDNGNGNNGNGNGNNSTTTTVVPTTLPPTTTVAPTTIAPTTMAPTTTTTSDPNEHCHDEHLECGYLECDDIKEEVIERIKPIRVEVVAHCNMLYSIDISKLPIIQAYRSDAYDKPHVLILEFDNGKQLKFYTNIRNHPHCQIKHIFLKNEEFQRFVKELGLNYSIDI